VCGVTQRVQVIECSAIRKNNLDQWLKLFYMISRKILANMKK